MDAIARETLAHQKLPAAAAGGRGDGRDGRARPLRQREAARGQRARRRGTSAPRPALGGVEATVVTLGPVGGAPALGQLLDVAADALFVVPCTATGVDELTVGNAEYGAVALAAKALWIVGAPSEALTLAVAGAKAHAKCDDHPPPPAEAEVLERMLPAAARALAVAPPDASAEEVEAIVLDEWVRTSSDEPPSAPRSPRAQGGQGSTSSAASSARAEAALRLRVSRERAWVAAGNGK